MASLAQWFALLPRLLTLLTSILEASKVNRELGVGRTEAVRDALDNAIMEIDRANKARLAQRIADSASGDPRLRDDGFRRP